MSAEVATVPDDPQDELGLAIKRFDSACRSWGWQEDQGHDGEVINASSKEHYDAGTNLALTVATVIKGAILSERERCAKIADDAFTGRERQQGEAMKNGDKKAERDFQSMKFEAIEIADAIRKGA